MSKTIKLLIVCASCIGYGIIWTLTCPSIGVLPVWVSWFGIPPAFFIGFLLKDLNK